MFDLNEYKKIWTALVQVFGKDNVWANKNGRRFKNEDEVIEALQSGGESISFSVKQPLANGKSNQNAVQDGLSLFLRQRENLEPAVKSRNDEVVFTDDDINLYRCHVFDVMKNDRNGWCDAWGHLRKVLSTHKKDNDRYIMQVYIQSEDDVTSLRYFIPLWFHFFRKKTIIQLYTTVAASENDRIYAIQEFFSYLLSLPKFNNLRKNIYLNGKTLNWGTVPGSMPPVLYYNEARDINRSKAFNNLIRNYLTFLCDIKNYIGTKENQLKDQANEKIKLQFLQFVLEKLGQDKEDIDVKDAIKYAVNSTCKISLLIFLIIMRWHLYQKSFFDFSQANRSNQITINRPLFELTWMNAKTYAEGLQQIIENAQVHSSGKFAVFGMRIYKANTDVPMGELTKNAMTRESLYRRFWHNRDANHIFNRRIDGRLEYKDFIEFYVLDDAILDENGGCIGIVDKTNENLKAESASKSVPKSVNSIEDIFELTEDDFHDNAVQFYTRHYGMRWFKRHIDNHNGLMEVYSPCRKEVKQKSKACVYSNRFALFDEAWFTDYENLYSTEYSVLVPLTDSIGSQTSDTFVDTSDKLFVHFESLKNLECISIDLKNIQDAYIFAENKYKFVEKIYENLSSEWGKPDQDRDLFCDIDATSMDREIEIEVLVKALFECLYYRKSKKHLYLAVRFNKHNDSEFPKEFIRLFSIFYLKSTSKDQQSSQPYMQNVQIAICTDVDQEVSLKSDVPQVNFVLGGKELSTAYRIANKFAYYNADACLEFLPLLDFLSVFERRKSKDGKKAKQEELSLFPFDLYLKLRDKPEVSWFQQQMYRRLATDLRTEEYGCKISDIYLRLGSKIYIDTFYEAELLFHNIGTIKRFAYMLAQDIFVSLPDLSISNDFSDRTIFLLGYENYSAILIQETYNLLQACQSEKWARIEWAIETRSEDYPVLSLDKYTRKEKEDLAETSDIVCITILPLGSTMTTIYKLHDSFQRGLKMIGGKAEPDFSKNYCLVAIGNTYTQRKENYGDEKEIIERYIDTRSNQEDNVIKTLQNNNDLTWHEVRLIENENGARGSNVKYLLSASARWINPEGECPSKPLLHVDRTSTLLDAIFQLTLSDEVRSYYCRNADRVDLLQPKGETIFLRYGHIMRGDNHYQFYFDFEKLVRVHKEKIIKWAADMNQKIESDAFNILISPLQITNSEFLKIVTDYAFGSNLHLLHIDIQNAGKEAIRTKFDYISAELNKIVQQHRKINFYYADDSVCTGRGLARASKLLLTLCNQMGNGAKEFLSHGLKFTKVFLLINRSSYETAQMWTGNPKDDWISFIDLCVPAYNTHTHNDAITCPECRVRDRFDLLRKRSASNELIEYFTSRVEKCSARNLNDYDFWQNNAILTGENYFRWLCEWVYFKENQGNFYKKLNKNLSNRRPITTIKELDIREEAIKKINYIIAEDNFRRLKSLDRAYRKLIYDKELQEQYGQCIKSLSSSEKSTSEAFQPYCDMLKKSILQIFAECLSDNLDQYDKTFLFISYIKAISRDYLAKNYFIKEVMYEFLTDLFNFMLGGNGSVNSLLDSLRFGEVRSEIWIFNRIKKLPPLFQYRIFKVVTHRLALMRAKDLIQPETINKIWDTYKAFRKSNGKWKGCDENAIKFLSLPSEKEMLISYLSSVKTVAIEENNDIVCLQLLDSAQKLYDYHKALSDSEYMIGFINRLRLENTRVLFGLMEELSNEIGNYLLPVDENWKYRGYVGCGSLSKRESIVRKTLSEDMNNGYKTISMILKQCLGAKKAGKPVSLYHNLYNNYLNFYQKALCRKESSLLEEKEAAKIAEMLNYFNILRYLTEPKFKEKRSENFESLPYIFEDLCFSIRNMTQAVGSYFIYREGKENSQIVAQSGFSVKADAPLFHDRDSDVQNFSKETDIDFDELSDCIDMMNDVGWRGDEGGEKNDIEAQEIIDGVIKIQKCDRWFLAFEFPFTLNGAVGEDVNERRFYLFLEMGKSDETDWCRISMRVLFLRNRLWLALKQNYANLLNFRYHYSYIQSVDQSKSLRILHLSDLHLEDDSMWEIGSHNLQKLLIGIEKAINDSKIDLLAVTGDIVNASHGANEAQKKYKRAANLLFEVVKKLWGVKDGAKGDDHAERIVLPHDWRRRIIITTGNHDYAAMNDVQVVTADRRVKTGLPASQSGGTMSKYAYFIEFLSDFLDVPMQNLIKQDLNELREYKGFELVIGNFNTCAEANALQNNKVAFNMEQIKSLATSNVWRTVNGLSLSHIVFSHHSPHYLIDYFADRYAPHKFLKRVKEINEIKDIYSVYLCTLIRFLCDKNYITKNEMVEATVFSFEWLSPANSDEEKFKKLVMELKKIDGCDRDLDKFINSSLFKDMEMFYNILTNNADGTLLSESCLKDEYQLHYLSDMSNLFKTMIVDNNELKRGFDSIHKGISDIIDVAGHEHEAKIYPPTGIPKTFVGQSLYTEGSKEKGRFNWQNALDGEGASKKIFDYAISFEIISRSIDAQGKTVWKRDFHSYIKEKEQEEWLSESNDEQFEKIKGYLHL